jgi:hypothetical protein
MSRDKIKTEHETDPEMEQIFQNIGHPKRNEYYYIKLDSLGGMTRCLKYSFAQTLKLFQGMVGVKYKYLEE